MRRSAQRREIEIDADGISLWWINGDAGRIRGEGLGKELELNSCADERATGIPTEVDGMARVEEWHERIIAVEDLDLEIPPEIGRPQQVIHWSARGANGRVAHDIRVGVG